MPADVAARIAALHGADRIGLSTLGCMVGGGVSRRGREVSHRVFPGRVGPRLEESTHPNLLAGGGGGGGETVRPVAAADEETTAAAVANAEQASRWGLVG